MLASLLLALSLSPAPPATPGKVDTGMAKVPGLGIELQVDTFTLANGLRVVVHEDHDTPTFALVVAYDVGSRDEQPGRTGFAHLFEHMMFKGSANVPEGGQFAHVMSVGGDVDAFTENDRTVYVTVLPSQYLERGLWLEADRMRSLAITEENLENQRNAVFEEKAMRLDNVPYIGAVQDFFAEIWAGSGYGHHMMGLDADLKAASTADVKAFFAKYYVPSNAVLVVSGDVTTSDVRTSVERLFADIPAGTKREPFPAVDHTQRKIERRVVDPLAPQPIMLVGWKTTPHDHPDRPALELLFDILLTGNSARITRVLQDEKNIAVPEPLGDDVSGGRDAGAVFSAFVQIGGAKAADVLAVVREHVAAVKTRGVTGRELKKAINGRAVATVQALATNVGRAELIAAGILCCGDPTHVLAELRRYRAVRPADIRRVAKRYLTDAWMLLEIVPPPRG